MHRKLLILTLLALAACGRGADDERDRAAGQILPGSASDAMLQTDRLQSEAPLAKPEAAAKLAAKGKTGAKTAEPATDSAAPETPAADASAPAATPTPEAAPQPAP